MVKEIINRRIGIEAVGDLFSGEGSPPTRLRIKQDSSDARYYRRQGRLQVGFSLDQNCNLILSVLNESPIFLRKTDHPGEFDVSSFVLGREGQVEEVTLRVNGEQE